MYVCIHTYTHTHVCMYACMYTVVVIDGGLTPVELALIVTAAVIIVILMSSFGAYYVHTENLQKKNKVAAEDAEQRDAKELKKILEEAAMECEAQYPGIVVAIDGPENGSCYCQDACDELNCGDDSLMVKSGVQIPNNCASTVMNI